MISYINPVLQVLILALHPIHVSVTECEYDEKEKQLEITMRIFADDLEQTLRRVPSTEDLDILGSDKSRLDDLMEPYLKYHFAVSLDNRNQTIHYLGHEQDGEALVFYIEVSRIKRWSSIGFKNDVLMDQFGDQSNLIHVRSGEQIKSLRLTKDVRSGILSF